MYGSTTARQHLEARDLAREHAVLDDRFGASVEDEVDEVLDRLARIGDGGDSGVGTAATRSRPSATHTDGGSRKSAARRATTPAASRRHDHRQPKSTAAGRPTTNAGPKRADAEILTEEPSAVPSIDSACAAAALALRAPPDEGARAW